MRITAPIAGSGFRPRTKLSKGLHRLHTEERGGTAGTMQAAPDKTPASAGAVPFVRASYSYREKMRTDTVILSAAAQTQVPINIIPGGFLRGVWIEVSGTGGVLGTAVLGSPTDFPFALIQNIQLEDVNGQTIVGPLSGYDLYLANKYGGYFPEGDPVTNPAFVGTYASPYFVLWVPCEIRSDGLGSLANTDARAQYRLVYTIDAGIAGSPFLSTGTVTTPSTLTITTWVDYWAQVESKSMEGDTQEQTPPALGTTAFWYHEFPVVTAGAMTIKHNRVGNAIREFAYIARNGAAAGAAQPGNQRVNAYSDPIKVRLDNRYLFSESPNLRRAIMGRLFTLTGTDGDPAVIGTPVKGFRETGVIVYPYNQGVDYNPSPGDLADWLLTNEAQFLQLEVTLTGTVTTVEILTNDVAPRG